jgi:hypothetical protein
MTLFIGLMEIKLPVVIQNTVKFWLAFADINPDFLDKNKLCLLFGLLSNIKILINCDSLFEIFYELQHSSRTW